MWEFFNHLLDPSGFPPRWLCGSWSPGLGWLHILSDLGVGAAYLAIPCVLGHHLVRRRDFPFRGVVRLFIAFIVACGLTHLMEAAIFWWPAYRLAGLLKFVTALVSWATVLALFRVTPQLLALRSPAELMREIADRTRAEGDLRALHARLELRVAERTAALKESEARFRAVFEATPSGLVLADPEGRIVLVNDLIVRMFGWEKAELLDQPVEWLLPERYRGGHPAHRAAYVAGPSDRPPGGGRDLTGSRKSGGEFPVEVGLRRVDLTGQMFVLASVTDTTARRQGEADLRASEERFRKLADAVPQIIWV